MCEESIRQNDAFPNDFQSQVATTDVIEQEILEQIQEIERMIISIEAMSQSMPSMQITLSILMSMKRKLQEKLERLYTFNQTSSNNYDTALQLAASIAQGLAEIQNRKGFNPSTGTFSTTGMNMEWQTCILQMIDKKNRTVLTIDEIGKDEIIKDLEKTYGFDKKTATLLYTIQQGILKKAKENNWDNQQVIYEYFRIIASCAPENYVSKRWKAICGTLKKDELNTLLKDYGLNENDARLLMDKVSEQHTSPKSIKDYAHEAVQIAAFTEKSWTWFPSPSNTIHNISHVANQGLEHSEISFKGDVDSGRYDNTDFTSDLDANNIYQRMLSSKQSNIFKTNTEYNFGIQHNSVNRVDEFYKNLGNGNSDTGKKVLDDLMEKSTFGSRHINDQYTDKQQQKHQDDFYKYLKQGENRNVER